MLNDKYYDHKLVKMVNEKSNQMVLNKFNIQLSQRMVTFYLIIKLRLSIMFIDLYFYIKINEFLIFKILIYNSK